MLTLITGGSASGKSDYAERCACAVGDTRVYIATMQPFDAECKARIEKHRTARADRGFVTIERYTALDGVCVPENAVVLLECLSNLVANELFSARGAGEDTVAAVLRGVAQLERRAKALFVVTNEICSDGICYDPQTMQYMRMLGEINRPLAEQAHRVVEVVYTIPVVLKGGERI